MGWDGMRNFADCNLQYFDFSAPSIWTFKEAFGIIYYDLCHNSFNGECDIIFGRCHLKCHIDFYFIF